VTTPGARPVWGRLAARAQVELRAAGVDEGTLAELAGHLSLLAEPVPGAPGAGAPTEQSELQRTGSLGELHEALLDDDHRRRRGVHYTPLPVAVSLVARARGVSLAAVGDEAVGDAVEGGRVPLVGDPSCGGGVFLVAAAEHLASAGHEPADVVAALHGIDLDPVAVEVARVALVGWAARAGLGGEALVAAAVGLAERIVVGDALVDRWPGEGRLDLVVGNPPFAGQLARTTARDAAAADAARALLGGASPGYADTAGLFLVRAALAGAPGARISLIQPLSFLGSRHAGVVRHRLDELAVLREVWIAGERVFGAAVDVCAPVLEVVDALSSAREAAAEGGRRSGSVRVGLGSDDAPVATVARSRLAAVGSWAPLVAAAAGVPAIDLDSPDHLGSWARATAGFRDEFYALVPFVHDVADIDAGTGAGAGRAAIALPVDNARLITAGLVDPGRTRWGVIPTRFAGRRFAAPAVDVAALRTWSASPDGDRRLAAWAEGRLRPKVVVATQTRVVEAAVDDDGTWWPSVPVISIVLDPDRDDDEHRWMVAAALMAPPVVAWAAERSAGTAMAAHALRLSARQLAEVPLPVDVDAWREGASILRGVAGADDLDGERRLLAAAGNALTEAHDLRGTPAADVLRWWADRAGCEEGIQR
jgi:methylase of polypeptide subunit release factors